MQIVKRTAVLLFALAVAGTAAIPSLAAEPLLRNGGMEELKSEDWDPDKGKEPLHWDVWPGNPAEGTKQRSISTSVKHGGKQSLCVELSSKNNQSVYQYSELKNDDFDFNKSYTFSVWIKMENVKAKDATSSVKIGFNRKGLDGERYDYRSDELPLGTYDWTKFSVTVEKPVKKMQQFDVIVDIGLGSGKIYIDDLEMVENTAPPTSPTKPQTQPTAGGDATRAPTAGNTTQAPSGGTTAAGATTTAAAGAPTDDASGETEGTTAVSATTGRGTAGVPGDEDGEGGFNALPLIIIGAVVVAAGAVAGAYFLIKKKKGGPSDPTGPDKA